MKFNLKPLSQIILDVKSFYENFKSDGFSEDERFIQSLANISENPKAFLYISNVLSNYPGKVDVSLDERIQFNEMNYAMALSHLYKSKNHKFIQADEIIYTKEPCEHNTVIVWCGEPMIVKISSSGKVSTRTITNQPFYGSFDWGIENTPHFVIGKI